jgi:membrane protease YdiL (CAAX protease family)
VKRFVVGTVVFLAVLILWSSLATYPVWMGLDSFGSGEWKFRRIFNRVLMVGAFVLLIPLARYWGIRAWSALGFRWTESCVRDMTKAFVSGLALVAALALWSVLWGHRVWHVEFVFSKSIGHFLSGWSVGFFEEIIFRGFFFLGVLAFTPRKFWLWVAVLGSAVFAGVHFFIDIHGTAEAPHWGSGWAMWRQLGESFLSPEKILTRWLSLFLAALVLCHMAWKQGHIWGAVALHAGWVFAIKSVNRLTDHAGVETLWAKNDLLSGLWASIMLGLYLIFLHWLSTRPGHKRTDPHEPVAGSAA